MDTEQWAWDGRPHACGMDREVALCKQNRSHFVIQIVENTVSQQASSESSKAPSTCLSHGEYFP